MARVVAGGSSHRYSYILYTVQFMHCTENPIYAFPEKKLCGLVPNSYIHVSVSDLYIPRMDLPIWLQQNRQTYCSLLTWCLGDSALGIV